MRPLAEIPDHVLANIDGLFLDIDDTLTTDGQLTAPAYSALARIKNAGLLVVPITGRPAGWCDHIARMWPVDAVVGENGSFYFRYDHKAREMVRTYWLDRATRSKHQRQLDAIRKLVLAEVKGSAIASDQAYRDVDLAIDFCEDVAPLSRQAVQEIVSIFEQNGAHAKVSSIHVNGWFGDFDKLSMTVKLLADEFQINLHKNPERYIFVGDSPNDAPMFGFFPNAVGVANVADFKDDIEVLPAWITKARSGQGFCQLVEKILAVR